MKDKKKVNIIPQMLQMISKESLTLLDLGGGTEETSKRLMKAVTEYWGVDYVNSGNAAIIEEYNQGDFPSVQADTVFCTNCLEYIKDVDSFLKKMCESSKREILLSYCTLEDESSLSVRKDCGFQNHMTRDDLMKKFRIHGFSLELTEKTDETVSVFKMINARQNRIRTVRWKSLTYLEEHALRDLMEAAAATDELDGCIIETGCALGGSGICIAHEKRKDKPLFIYDVFGMIPAPGEKDGEDVLERYQEIRQGKSFGIGGDLYYGYQDNLLEKVKNSFCSVLGLEDLRDANIEFIKGLFEDTLICRQPVAMAHIDCDWYDSVMVCLERIAPMLVSGGILVIDDYDHWSGCKRAVDAYFQDKKEQFLFEKKSRLHIIKK